MSGKTPRAVGLLRYFGLLLLAALIVYANPIEMANVLRRASPWWLLLGFILNVPQLGLKAFRWHRIVRWQGLALSYPRALLAYFGSLLVGFLTPGRLGEMAKAFTLKYESGASLAHGLSSVVLDRVFDMIFLLVLGVLGVFRFTIVGSVLPWPTFLLICILLFLPLLFLHEGFVRKAGAFAARLPVLRRSEQRVLEKVDQFASGLAVMGPGRIFECICLTIAAYSVFYLQVYCCAWALGFTVPLLDLVLLMAATNFLSFIPISISGLGTRELCLTFFLARVTPPQPEATAVLFGLMIFLVFFVGGGLIGFVCWQWAPIGLQDAWKEVRRNRGR